MAVKDTAWMGNQQGKVSHDGTNQLLSALARHPRITVNSKPEWGGKTEMILQANTKWPVKDLKSFLPWVGPNASADLLFKS